MALPTTNLSVSDVAQEFGGVIPHALDEYYKGGVYVTATVNTPNVPTSGAISLQDFGGQQLRVTIPLDISSSVYNYNVATNALAHPNYAAGLSDVVVTVYSGVYVGSTSTATYSMIIPNTLNGSDTVTLINNGSILGNGGAGGNANSGAGNAGGSALYINRPTTVQNNSIIASGGGGGGAGAVNVPYKGGSTTGGGGGGGAGYAPGGGGSGQPAGGSGTATGGGAGGYNGTGGTGGTGGAPGSGGSAGNNTTGGGGAQTGGAGGAGGSYLVGNSFVTWQTYGTLQGSIS